MCCPSLPQADEFRWEKRDDEWIPAMTKEAPAPEAIVQLVKVRVSKEPIFKQSMPPAEIRLEVHLPLFLLGQ